MIHYIKDLNSVCNFNETPEMNEDLDEEIEEFVEMNEIIITNDDADGHDDDNNDNDNGINDDYVDDTSLNVNSVKAKGKNIAIALGETANHYEKKIIFLDKCKIRLKKTPENNEKYNNYINSLVPLQTLVLKLVSNIEKKISAWEK